MNYWQQLYNEALKIATKAHAGQFDRCEKPYIEHPLFVARQQTDPEARVVALLHDVIEDCSMTAQDLLDAGMPQGVVENVALLSHDPAEPYLDYIARIKGNPVAEAVKLADLAHNSDPARLPSAPGAADRERLEKYKRAAEMLKE